jgi:hypothetical protein
MNYLLESKAFHESIALNDLSSGQIALWHCLFNINNKCAWAEWFSVTNMVLSLYSGLSASGIKVARNKLKQCGYIDFRTRGTKATQYHINSLLTSNSVRDSNQDSGRDSVRDSNQDSGRKGSALNKQNKTKLNKTNNTNQSKLNAPTREGNLIPIFKLNGEVK